MTRHVALLGHPVAHSRSPLMQNAAFAASRLDWHYSAFDVADPLAAVAALRTLGFEGANVTIPHKRAVVAACDEADGVGQHAPVPGRPGDRPQHRPRDPARHRRAAGLPDRRRRRGGGAARLAPGRTRSYSRSGEWPPDAEGCDLIVNATPLTEELLVAPHAGQTVVELAYRADGAETALVAAAGRRLRVVDGLEALVRQGAASFELWTGLPAPVELMREALGAGG